MRTLLIAVLTGVAGALLAFAGGDMATAAHNVSNFEGGRAMGIVFLIVPAGFVVSLIVGIVTARVIRGPGFPAFAKAQGTALLVTTVLAGVIFGYAMMRAPTPPEIDGHTLDLEFEVRMPEGRPVPDPDAAFTVLVTSRGYGDDRANADLRLDAATLSDGRTVIPARAVLNTSTTQRFLVVNDVDEQYYWFDLPLRARPTAEDETWTNWWPQQGQSATTDIHGNGGFQIRYRVQQRPLE